VNDCHFGYITKSFNETQGQTVEKEMQQQVYFGTVFHLGSMTKFDVFQAQVLHAG
jgi:hypothetical protein